MSDIRKTLKKLDEMTSAGGVAPVAMPMGEVKERTESPEKSPKVSTPREWSNWQGASLKKVAKSKKVAESKAVTEAELDEEKLDGKDKKKQKELFGKSADKALGAKPVDKEIQAKQLKESIDTLEHALAQVKEAVRAIKYDEVPMDIMTKVQMLATEYKIDIKYELDEVIQAERELAGAIYNLVSPFEDAVSSIRDRMDQDEVEAEHQAYMNRGR